MLHTNKITLPSVYEEMMNAGAYAPIYFEKFELLLQAELLHKGVIALFVARPPNISNECGGRRPSAKGRGASACL